MMIRFGRPDATEDNKATFPQAHGGIGEADPNPETFDVQHSSSDTQHAST